MRREPIYYERETIRDLIFEKIARYAELTGYSRNVAHLGAALDHALARVPTVPENDIYVDPFGPTQCVQLRKQVATLNIDEAGMDLILPAVDVIVNQRYRLDAESGLGHATNGRGR